MFGFLKQKLADFGNKLKQTISKEEIKKEDVKEEAKIVETKKETPILQKETKTKEIETKEVKKVEEKKQPIKEEKKTIPKKEEKIVLIEEKKEIKPKQIVEPKKELLIETKKEENDKIQVEKQKLKEIIQETKLEEKKPTLKETTPIQEVPKPKGILSKIFGLGKKEVKPIIIEKKETKLEEKIPLKETISKEETKKEEIKELVKEVPKEKKIIEPVKDNIIEPIQKKESIKIETKRVIEKPLVKEKLAEINPFEEIEEGVEEAEEELNEKEEQPMQKEKHRDIRVVKVDEDKRELKANIGVGGGLKGLIFGGIQISEKQIEDLLWELELSLIESDVEQDAARELVSQIKQRLVGKKVSTKNIDEYLKEQIKEILTNMMETEKINVLDKVKEAKSKGEVYKILILGPNGAGKTTSIAKLVHYFQKNKLTCILAAGDTFRAGAIDQIEIHAKALNVRVIKHQYGADPAAIAFDAISAATASKIDVVIIDSAGRQETNKNLMEELKKLERVAKPNLKLFVGESYVGQGLLDQVDEFSKIIGIDGYILTKMDTDAKGGTAISLTYKTKKPIIFIGTGQGYDDFEEFTPEYILNRII